MTNPHHHGHRQPFPRLGGECMVRAFPWQGCATLPPGRKLWPRRHRAPHTGGPRKGGAAQLHKYGPQGNGPYAHRPARAGQAAPRNPVTGGRAPARGQACRTYPPRPPVRGNGAPRTSRGAPRTAASGHPYLYTHGQASTPQPLVLPHPATGRTPAAAPRKGHGARVAGNTVAPRTPLPGGRGHGGISGTAAVPATAGPAYRPMCLAIAPPREPYPARKPKEVRCAATVRATSCSVPLPGIRGKRHAGKRAPNGAQPE